MPPKTDSKESEDEDDENKEKEGMHEQNKDKKDIVPYKKIMINGIGVMALIDTGSDVNLITKSEFEKIKDSIEDYKTKSTCLTGIAENKVNTAGIFSAIVQIDQYHADVKFCVVKDHDIPVTVVIGNPILKDFEVHFPPDGVYMEKIMHLTLLVEDNKAN
ncbi:unnamed protein product [Arctia plantaginis]|uniref:Peptidase A2 domain-containing protein n=1 Tax=Arctia plantaginis TaxID=874455 RepID=A0A8S0ZMN5_ARCPL|nr:unnamed protein product [Arctia plantaginis]